MKIYKKIALLLIIVMMSLTLNVYADAETNVEEENETDNVTAELVATPSSTSVKVGETVEIRLTAKCQTGVTGATMVLEYDKTKLEFINEQEVKQETSLSDWIGTTNEKFRVSITSRGDNNEQYVATLKFKVLDTATIGETLSVKFTEVIIGDIEYNELEKDDKQIDLTVIEDTLGEGDQEPGDQEPGDQEPGNQEPGNQEQGDQNQKDNTTADKDYNYAGIQKYALIVILAIMVVAIAFYVKCKKYRGIK